MDLARYRSVARNRRLPAYVRSEHRRLGTVDLARLDTEELWLVHDSPPSHRTGPSLLDLKIELAERMLHSCALCERRCGADRAGGETGFCGVGTHTRCFFEQVLWAEEAPVVPSHEVFLTGCNMRCRFCYAWDRIIDPSQGKGLPPEDFAACIDLRRSEGATNVNIIGGDPTVNLPAVLRALKLVTRPTAVVWNSNFYMSEETMKLLDGVVDLYLGDFKFGNDGCASEIGGTDRYFAAADRNFRMAAESGDLVIRHLILPGHVDCCLRPVAEWVAANLPEAPFNLMFQYLPCGPAVNDLALGRPVFEDEKARALEIVQSLGLNTTRWNKPLRYGNSRSIGSGEISTTIHISADGRVSIMHLHGELRDLVATLQAGG